MYEERGEEHPTTILFSTCYSSCCKVNLPASLLLVRCRRKGLAALESRALWQGGAKDAREQVKAATEGGAGEGDAETVTGTDSFSTGTWQEGTARGIVSSRWDGK